MGTAKLKATRINGEHQVVRIERVLFVPGLTSNLLSVGRIAERGFKVNFRATECVIMKGSNTIAVGKKKDGLYIVK